MVLIFKDYGNVGIGNTTSPTEKLDVNGSIRILATTFILANLLLILYDSSTLHQDITILIIISEGIYSVLPLSMLMVLDVNVMILGGNGNVGIGGQPDTGGNKLKMYGQLDMNDYWINNVGGVNAPWFQNKGDVYLKADGGVTTIESTTSVIDFITNSAERMRITSGGNVGIGTTSPDAKLDVYKNFSGVLDGNYAARIYGTDGGLGETGIRICEKGGESLINNSTKALDVYSNGTSKMVLVREMSVLGPLNQVLI